MRLTTTGPDWSEHAYDVYDQIRANAIGALALWRLPQALPLIRERQRDNCFRAFLHNNWFGASVFAGIALDSLVRKGFFR